MTKTIAELWKGELSPIVTLGKNDSEMRQLEKLIVRNLETLLENRPKEQQEELFEKCYDCITEYVSLATEHAFCDGFCLGSRITAEALIGAEQII